MATSGVTYADLKAWAEANPERVTDEHRARIAEYAETLPHEDAVALRWAFGLTKENE